MRSLSLGNLKQRARPVANGTSLLNPITWREQMSLGLSTIFSIQRWKIEFHVLNMYRTVFIICVMIQFLHSTATNLAYFRHRRGERLVDAGFDFFPYLDPSLHWISEVITFGIIIGTIILGFIPFFYSKPPFYMATFWVRALFVMGICISLRCLSFLATGLPGPAPHCQPLSSEYSPPETVYDVFLRIDVFKGCGDLIFSSHTSISMSFVLTAHYYLKHFWGNDLQYKLVVFGLYWPLLFANVCLIIAARKHYTVDVVVALYTTPLVFHASLYVMPDPAAQDLEYQQISTADDDKSGDE